MNIDAELQGLCAMARAIHALSRDLGRNPADMTTAMLTVHTMAETLHYRLERIARALGHDCVERAQGDALATQLRRH
jgi:hypothetical protein